MVLDWHETNSRPRRPPARLQPGAGWGWFVAVWPLGASGARVGSQGWVCLPSPQVVRRRRIRLWRKKLGSLKLFAFWILWNFFVRYADDFLILHEDKKYLENLIPQISVFLKERLKLILHPNKVFIKTIASGVDFLGWVHFPNHRVLRTATRKRMMKRIIANSRKDTIDSYLGLLKHGNAYKIRNKILGA